MAEKFIDLMELLRGRIDPGWKEKSGFLGGMFFNLGLIYAVYAAKTDDGPTVQFKSAAGSYALPMRSEEDAIVAAKIIIGATQTILDDASGDHENMLQRYLDRFEKIVSETKETENADG